MTLENLCTCVDVCYLFLRKTFKLVCAVFLKHTCANELRINAIFKNEGKVTHTAAVDEFRIHFAR